MLTNSENFLAEPLANPVPMPNPEDANRASTDVPAVFLENVSESISLQSVTSDDVNGTEQQHVGEPHQNVEDSSNLDAAHTGDPSDPAKRTTTRDEVENWKDLIPSIFRDTPENDDGEEERNTYVTPVGGVMKLRTIRRPS